MTDYCKKKNKTTKTHGRSSHCNLSFPPYLWPFCRVHWGQHMLGSGLLHVASLHSFGIESKLVNPAQNHASIGTRMSPFSMLCSIL